MARMKSSSCYSQSIKINLGEGKAMSNFLEMLNELNDLTGQIADTYADMEAGDDEEDEDSFAIACLLTDATLDRRMELLQIVVNMAQAQTQASVILDNKSATVFEIVQREYPKMAKLVGLHLPEVEA
jgi:hypothetical protein